LYQSDSRRRKGKKGGKGKVVRHSREVKKQPLSSDIDMREGEGEKVLLSLGGRGEEKKNRKRYYCLFRKKGGERGKSLIFIAQEER